MYGLQHFGAELRRLRKAKELTMLEVCKRLGIPSIVTLDAIESGVKAPLTVADIASLRGWFRKAELDKLRELRDAYYRDEGRQA